VSAIPSEETDLPEPLGGFVGQDLTRTYLLPIVGGKVSAVGESVRVTNVQRKGQETRVTVSTRSDVPVDAPFTLIAKCPTKNLRANGRVKIDSVPIEEVGLGETLAGLIGEDIVATYTLPIRAENVTTESQIVHVEKVASAGDQTQVTVSCRSGVPVNESFTLSAAGPEKIVHAAGHVLISAIPVEDVHLDQPLAGLVNHDVVQAYTLPVADAVATVRGGDVKISDVKHVDGQTVVTVQASSASPVDAPFTISAEGPKKIVMATGAVQIAAIPVRELPVSDPLTGLVGQ
jgi:hypothetical protein